MPNTVQSDIDDSIRVCDLLEIEWHVIDIGNAYYNIVHEISCDYLSQRPQIQSPHENPMIKTNLPARLRMATLYAVAALYPNSRVVNTCNYSEDYVGYSTKYGDAAGDFSPLGNLTVREVLEIGDELGLPKHLVHKTPSDGMCGKIDEDNLGFTYNELDDFLLNTGKVSEETMRKIEHLHLSTRHKYEPIPTYNPNEMVFDLGQLTIDDDAGDNSPFATGGLVNGINVSGNTNSITIDPIYHFTPSGDNVNLKALADNIQKVIDSAGCGLLRRGR
jgi:NAD+ synthase